MGKTPYDEENKKILNQLKDYMNTNDDIITLSTSNGNEIDFIDIAGIALNGNFYAILQPVNMLPGMNEDEALVFQVIQNDNGEDNFNIVLDDNVIDAVFKEYDRLFDEAVSNDEDE